MANYQLVLTPAHRSMADEGGLDEWAVNTGTLEQPSLQRTGYVEVWSTDSRKVLEVVDGGEFDDSTFQTAMDVLPAVVPEPL